MGSEMCIRDSGLTLPKKAVAESTANIDGGELAIKELLAKGVKFTAVVAYNDLMAIGAIHALFDAGLRVPEDVSVIGFDDLPAARSCRPRLTTMHYPIEEMAAYAAKLAISLSDPANSPGSKTHLFIPELVERDSVSQMGGTNK